MVLSPSNGPNEVNSSISSLLGTSRVYSCERFGWGICCINGVLGLYCLLLVLLFFVFYLAWHWSTSSLVLSLTWWIFCIILWLDFCACICGFFCESWWITQFHQIQQHLQLLEVVVDNHVTSQQYTSLLLNCHNFSVSAKHDFVMVKSLNQDQNIEKVNFIV